MSPFASVAPAVAEPRHWHRIDLVVPDAAAELLSAECFERGSCGLQNEVADVGYTRITAYFSADLVAPEIRVALEQVLRRAALPPVEIQVSQEVAADWNAEWRKFYLPVWATENIVVHPPWIHVDLDTGQIAVVIDPAMAFGTGGHESTQTALASLEATKLKGNRVLDVGTGSGVLAVAAFGLGAATLVGVDIDPIAIDNAHQNLRANLGDELVDARVQLCCGSAADVDGRFDVIVANIEGHILLPMLGDLISRLAPEGCIIFAGLILREEEHFVATLAACDLIINGRWQRDNWFSCRAVKGALPA